MYNQHTRGLGLSAQLVSLSISVICLGSVGAIAQDSYSNNNERFVLEEIIVTAQKRPRTLHHTPIAVSVVTADTLEKAHVLDISDLQSVVASLRVTTLQTTANTNFVIRGFGNGANNAGIEPSIGVFVDGVYRSRSAAQIGDLPRLERVEVLRGPQSTLFGKNASAGVISLVTAAPSYDPEGAVEASYGNYNARMLKGYFTTGLSDTFAVSFSGGINKRDGYTESTNGLRDINDRNRWHVRGQALWEPSQDISYRLIADYSELDELCCGVTNIINGPTAPVIQLLGGRILDDSNPFSYTTPINKRPINEIKDGGISLQANINLGSFLVTSISAFRSNDSLNDSEPDYTSLDLLDSALNDASINTWTQEFRVQSIGENTLDWMIGWSFFKEDITQIQGIEYGDALRPYIDLLTGTPNTLATGELLSGSAPGTFFSGDTLTRETFTQGNKAYSLFASVDFHLNDRLTLTGGLNYTNDTKTVTGSTVNDDVFSSIDLFTVNGGSIPTALFAQGFMGATGLDATATNIASIEAVAPGTSAGIQAGVNSSITALQALQFLPQFLAFPNAVQGGISADDKLTWAARLSYEMNDAVNVYFSIVTGYKSTSWNLSRDARPFIANQAALEASGLVQINQTYGTLFAHPEETTVYEFGLKARFAQGTINIAAFDQIIDGFQSNSFLGTGFVLTNAGKQSTKGIEVDATWVPSKWFEFRFSGTFLDPVYDAFQGSPGPDNTIIDLSGERPAGIHGTSMSTSATYYFESAKDMNGYLRADWLYESDAQVVEHVPSVDRKVSTFNASMGFEWGNNKSLRIWARNLFNNKYFLGAFPGVIQSGTLNGYVNTPRMYGVSAGYKF